MREIVSIPIARIHVPNPRVRNPRVHREIIDNIAAIGLKRPITVTRRQAATQDFDYDLVCGQGRLEAFVSLGRDEIPALVIAVDEKESLLMSLVENIARRKHTSLEHVREIERLHAKGCTQAQIANKIGMTAGWVGMLIGLVERAEERLLIAVETGALPIPLAVEISKTTAAGAQQALAEAYANGLRGRKLGIIRRMLERRTKYGKTQTRVPKGNPSPKLTAEYLRRIYQREVEKQTLLAKKADYVHSKLMFVVQAMRNLLQEPEFFALLKSENLATLPAPLAERMGIAGAKR